MKTKIFEIGMVLFMTFAPALFAGVEAWENVEYIHDVYTLTNYDTARECWDGWDSNGYYVAFRNDTYKAGDSIECVFVYNPYGAEDDILFSTVYKLA